MFATRTLRLAASTTRRAAAEGVSAPALATRAKTSTGVTGVDVHPTPLKALDQAYAETLSVLKTLPETSVYRQSTTAITQHRHAIVQDALAQQAGNESDAAKIEDIIKAVEDKLDTPMIEDVLRQAEAEKALAAKMLDWKP